MKTKLNLKNAKGMTLIELTVVILVLLSLISVLFIGAKAWKDGADRADCIVYIGQFQKGVRSWGNIGEKSNTDSWAQADIEPYVGTYKTKCKASDGQYTYVNQYNTTAGTVFASCVSNLGGGLHAPAVGTTASW